ncbi:hypothetical protein HUJ05_001014 [Dendroctonus ponderosae]|nr:hypothetical protein HUJ05_001014 [Dendroctonus ponderosae]
MKDELLAISEKVVIRMDDLITWITVETEWTWGRLAKCEEELKEIKVEPDQLASPRKPAGNNFALSEITMDFSDIEQERLKYEIPPKVESHVIVLSFPKYCRYRAMMKRLEGVERQYLKYSVVNALGGFYVKHPNTRILFCRDTFDYPELEGHELLCNHLAPKLKGRPRGKRKKRSISPGSESNESESSITNQFSRHNERSNGASPTNSTVATRRSTRCHENNENKQFMKLLASFMKAKHLPLGRVPSLGYKELNLHEFYTRVQKLGGYECVTTNRLWKSIFDDMTGHLNSTSAATIIRRHYERFLLAYERHEKGEEDKPLPTLERRRLKSRQSGTGSSDSESGPDTPSTSRSSTSPPVGTENKEITSAGKPSSLRSVRVKVERQKEKNGDKTNAKFQTASELVNSDPTASDPCIVKAESYDSKPIIEDSEMEKSVYIEEELDVKVEVKMETDVVLHEAVNVKDEEKPKSEPYEINPSIPEGSKSEGSIPAEPTTNAVAPIATTVVPEHNLSPLEGKENIPVVKTADVATVDVSPKSIPCSASFPETVKAEVSEYKSEDDSTMRDVKKIKLEILKDGGLEVTPVRSGSIANNIKEFRPSVIQPPTNNFAKPIMAPPSSVSSVLPKRSFALSLPSSTNVTHLKSPCTPAKQAKSEPYQFLNGTTPPKVVQSKSIYSYSEKTVYGNPKDVLHPTMLSHTPKSIIPNVRLGGTDPVDLSLTSPQKAHVELIPAVQTLGMRARSPGPAYNRASVTKNLYKTSPPLLGGRKLGPNLEITLVGPKQQAFQAVPKQSTSHKRPGSETYAQKIAKLKSEELSSRHSKYNIPHMHKSSVDIPVPSPYGKNNVSVNAAKLDFRQSGQKNVGLAMPQAMPPYITSRYPVPDNSNGINPYLPIMDSLYYQAALQNVYSNFNMPPLLPIASPDQLKFYADLMAHGRLNMPFPHPADGHPSMSNNNNNNSNSRKP